MLGKSSGLPSCVVEAARCCDPRSHCVSIRERVAPSRVSTTLLAYLAVTKPRVIELLLVTAIPAMLLAHRGSVNPLLILNTLIGGMLAAGGATTRNCVGGAGIEQVM